MKKIITFIGSIFGGLFGAWGGSSKTSKGWRRYGIPGLINVIGLSYKKLKSFIIWAWSGIMSIGYGIPSKGDSGSSLGRFWFNLFKGNRKLADVGTKFTLGFMFAIVLAIVGIFKGNLDLLKITVPLAIGSHVIFGGIINKMGIFKLFGKELTWIEMLRYLTLTLAGIIQILF